MADEFHATIPWIITELWTSDMIARAELYGRRSAPHDTHLFER